MSPAPAGPPNHACLRTWILVHPNQSPFTASDFTAQSAWFLNARRQPFSWNAQETSLQQVQQAAVHSPSLNRLELTKLPYVSPCPKYMLWPEPPTNRRQPRPTANSAASMSSSPTFAAPLLRPTELASPSPAQVCPRSSARSSSSPRLPPRCPVLATDTASMQGAGGYLLARRHRGVGRP